MKNLHFIYNFITSQNNAGTMSYSAKEFGVDSDACFVWDSIFGCWLLCAKPKLVNVFGDVMNVEETVDDVTTKHTRYSGVTIQWTDTFSPVQPLRIEQFRGFTAYAFQHELFL